MSAGWIGVDFDGTLVFHDGPLIPIGRPVPAMVARVRRARARGLEVRIFTARVSDPDRREQAKQVEAIEAWCVEHIGEKLQITCRKDYAMLELWDDRAVQVEMNTGRFVGQSRFDEPVGEAYTTDDDSSGAAGSGSEG